MSIIVGGIIDLKLNSKTVRRYVSVLTYLGIYFRRGGVVH